MKRLLIVFCITLVMLFSIFPTTYTIDTKYGEREVVVPDGYTDKDVLLAIAKKYYEQTEDFDALQTKAEELTQQVDQYVSENQNLRNEYNDLFSLYERLVSKYQTLNSLDWLKGYAGGEISYSIDNSISGFQLDIGALLFKNFLMKTGLGFSFGQSVSESLTLSIGFGYFF